MLQKDARLWKWINAAAYVATVAVNGTANYLRIGGKTTEEVSQTYPTLISPMDVTFAIWGLIYLLVFGFVLVQLGVFGKKGLTGDTVRKQIGPLFALSCALNIAWIILWHAEMIGAATVVMAALLVVLLCCEKRTARFAKVKYLKWLVWAPFSVYAGWVTIAAITNASTWLVQLGWSGFGISPEAWTMIVLAGGFALGVACALLMKNWLFLSAMAWGYGGIAAKHVLQTKITSIAAVAVIMTVGLVALAVKVAITQHKQKAVNDG